MEKIKEYTDNGDNYIKPERKFENEVLEIRLYCEYQGCKQYIKGHEGYNGSFVAETGQPADLRNECWFCEQHSKEILFLEKIFFIPNIGKMVRKCSITSKKANQQKFQSGQLINTVKDIIIHPILDIPAYTFEEDESYVECRRCKVVDEKIVIPVGKRHSWIRDKKQLRSIHHLRECRKCGVIEIKSSISNEKYYYLDGHTVSKLPRCKR